jgi:hypothetical protein
MDIGMPIRFLWGSRGPGFKSRQPDRNGSVVALRFRVMASGRRLREPRENQAVLTEDRMPANPEGVYPDGRGRWYFQVTIGRGPLTGER